MPEKDSTMESGERSKASATAGRGIGDTVGSAAESVHSTFQQAKKSTSDAFETVTDRLQASADYIEDRGVAGVMSDVETIVRRYPLQALMVGVGVGFVLSRIRR